MLGMFNLLPLLEGWDYKRHIVEDDAVVRGVAPMSVVKVDRIIKKERGWLIMLNVESTDAYGTLIMQFRGAGGEVHKFRFYPEQGRIRGAYAQDPAGWLQVYRRPNPYSTQGMYIMICYSAGWQGTTWPFVPPVKMKLYLPKESTQETAFIRGDAFVIAITDEEAFKESLKPFTTGPVRKIPTPPRPGIPRGRRS